MSYFDKPNPSTRDCLWCGGEVNPSMSTRWDKAPWIGDRAMHLGCVETIGRVMRTLAHNLAIAGALCHAWRLGRVALHLERLPNKPLKPWSPGCGRQAAGCGRSAP